MSETTTGVIELTDANFDEVTTGKVALVDFWAVWCGPCRMIAPIIKELAAEYGDQAVISKLDVDKNPKISQNFGIRNLPTIGIIKDGKMIDKLIGAAPKAKIEAFLKNHLPAVEEENKVENEG